MAKIKEQSILTIPNDLTYLPAVQAFAVELGKKIGFSSKELNEITLGVEEVVVNVIQHAFDPDQKTSFSITLRPFPEGLRIIIREKGIPVDPSTFPVYHPDRIHTDSSGAGLGIYLTGEVMDEYAFHYLGKRGNEIHLVKYIKGKHVLDYLPDDAKPGSEKKEVIKEEITLPLAIRLMKPDEALEVARLVYGGYGYSYVRPDLYFPDRIKNLNASGKMISAVAVTPEGRIAGHMALSREENGSLLGEIGYAVVDLTFRKQGIAEELTNFLIQESSKWDLTAIYGDAVTNHPYSQKISERFGFSASGILFGILSSTVSFKSITQKLPQRESIVLVFRYLKKPPRRKIYPPPHHTEMIAKLYRSIGGNPEVSTVEGIPLKEESSIKLKMIPDFKISELVVDQYGKDFIPQLKAKMKESALRNIKFTKLILNLQDPATALMTGELEKLGFFLGGILPGDHFQEALILQHLNNIRMDYHKIHLSSDTAIELMEYIKQVLD